MSRSRREEGTEGEVVSVDREAAIPAFCRLLPRLLIPLFSLLVLLNTTFLSASLLSDIQPFVHTLLWCEYRFRKLDV